MELKTEYKVPRDSQPVLQFQFKSLMSNACKFLI